MLCPLRKMVKSATFEECYKEKCSWWFVDSCAIQAIAFILGHIFLRRKDAKP